ncbi:MAG: hypothetical protein FJ265_17910 [Planctomycetes bacterium]|nr:hypothetical protein [Planctomycetota bacterium]
MQPLLGVVFCTALLAPPQQQPGARPAAKPEAAPPPTRVATVEFDANGWPIVVDEPGAARPQPAPAPLGEMRRPGPPAGAAPPATNAPPAGAEAAPPGSGMAPNSPLLEVFQWTRAPGTFQQLGGLQVWWRVTILDPQGAVLGYREITQTADCRAADRDRLEYLSEGRIDRACGRSGAAVYAELKGRPWPSLVEVSGHELALFGVHLRLPWCFGDAAGYTVLSRDVVERAGERLQRIVLERRPPGGQLVLGPEVEPRPRDRFELLCEPSGGRPRELVHRLVHGERAGAPRRVLLEEWVEHDGVPFARRRTYVDGEGRPTTVLEVQRIETVRTSERDFRAH